MTRTLVSLLTLVAMLLVPDGGASRIRNKEKPLPCEPGRYFVDDGIFLVEQHAPMPRDVIAIGDTIAIASGCAPIQMRDRVTKQGTKFNLTFRDCDGFMGAARLRGQIDPSCLTMHAVFRSKKDHMRTEFTATRSVCGDGIFDPAAGEACETGVPCGAGTCVECACVGATTSTAPVTTTLAIPTTTVTPTTAPPTTTHAPTTTTHVPTTTAIPTTTHVPTTTHIPTTTHVPTTTQVATTTHVPTTTALPTTTTTTSSTTTTLCMAQAPSVPPLKVVAVNSTALAFATFAVQPPGTSDWYVAEQRGYIWIVRNGTTLTTPFLDLTTAMGPYLGERGILSIAFHPNYAQNGRFFTYATPADGNDGTYAQANQDAIVEWARNPANHDVALPTKVRDIAVLPPSADNHNGGAIVFGPDGYLYSSHGDGGGVCENAEPGATQDVTKLFGKILRLDVDGAAPFAAPGNPFANDPRVFAYGLRNPFRMNFDPPTGTLFIGDVGQDAYEEIDVIQAGTKGQNFGWPVFEGPLQGGTCGTNKTLGPPSPHTPPILAIDRRVGSPSPFADYQSIIAGRVYRGNAIPSLKGAFLFADFYGAQLGAFRYCNGQVYGPVAVQLSQIPVSAGTLDSITSFVEGHDGEVYVTYGTSTRIGKIAPQ